MFTNTNASSNPNPTTLNSSIPNSSKDDTEFISSLPPEVRQIIDTLPDDLTCSLQRYGDTWVLKDALTFDSPEFFFIIPFYSDGRLYKQFSHYYNGDTDTLYYDTLLVKDSNSNWRKNNYRIVSFTTKLENKLLHWLESNAVRL